MRKYFYLAMIAMVAFVATGCNKGKSVEGTWYYVSPLGTESVFTVNTGETKNAPATITWGGEEYKIVLNYSTSDGKGTFAPAEGKDGAQGAFEVMEKDQLSMDLYLIIDGSSPSLRLKNGLYVKK